MSLQFENLRPMFIRLIQVQIVKKWIKQKKKSKTRYFLLKQFAQTENAYIKNLYFLQNSIRIPLTKAKLITQKEGQFFFQNIQQITQFSQMIHKQLLTIIKDWNSFTTKIGQKMIHYHEFLILYTPYWSNQIKLNEKLQKINQKPQIHILSKINHSYYTSAPVRRVGQYKLFLQRYYKQLSENHIDYALVGKAAQKYEFIVGKVNNIVDQKILNKKLLQLDRRYGEIILQNNVIKLIKQFPFHCHYAQLKCRIQVFNNMLLLINQQIQKEGQIIKRLKLNGISFVQKKNDLKHHLNIIYVCGSLESAHLNFDQIKDATRFYLKVDSAIKQLYKDQKNKIQQHNEAEIKKQNLSKIGITTYQQLNAFKGYNHPKLQILVKGTDRRNDQTVYYVSFKIIYPYISSQILRLSMRQLTQVYLLLQNSYKDIHFPKIDEKPDYIGFFEASRNKTRIIEYHSFEIQVFLNYIFRNQILHTSWETVAKKLGINSALIEFATSAQFTCNCNLCIEKKNNQQLQNCEFKLDKINEGIKSVQRNCVLQTRQINGPKVDQQEVVYKRNCSIYFFQIMQNVYNAGKSNIMTFNQKMLALEAQIGSFRSNLLIQKATTLQKKVKLKIHYFTIEDKYLEMNLTQDLRCREIIQQFLLRNNIKTAFDWGLFLEEDGQVMEIGKDDYILQFAKKWGVQLEQVEQEQEQDDSSFSFTKMLGGIRKWSDQLVGRKKSRLYIKKYLYFDSFLQLQQLKDSKERQCLIINQQFKRFKCNQINLDISQIVDLCCVYMLTTQFHQIKQSLENIQMQKIKNILPKRHYSLIMDPIFKFPFIQQIKLQYNKLSKCKDQNKRFEHLYTHILKSLNKNRQWITQYFALTSYMEGNKSDILLGVTHDKLTILTVQNRQTLQQIQLTQLQYKISTFSIFINKKKQKKESEDNEEINRQIQFSAIADQKKKKADEYNRYDGKNIWKIKELIDTYLAYGKLFMK